MDPETQAKYNVNAERRIPVYKLLQYKNTLKQLQSFSDPVFLCNFTSRQGSTFGKGKTYVDEHNVAEHKQTLRGVDLLDIHYLLLTDTCVLTEAQMKDYRIISGADL
jgi:hypothetical protein